MFEQPLNLLENALFTFYFLLFTFYFSLFKMLSLNEDLIRAIVKGDTAAVESLLAQGADANTTGGVTTLGASNTALMWAATEGYLDIVELLLAHNADVNAKNLANYTALMFAAESDRRNIVSILLDRGADIGDA
jgi:uncharacterized protein